MIRPWALALILIQTLTSGLPAHAGKRVDHSNHPFLETYWSIRERLVRDFIRIGTSPGKSLMMGVRTDDTVVWMDTPIMTAWYMAVLATENALLRKSGQNTDRNVQELYYALKALERVDRITETRFKDPKTGLPGTPSLNGFFIRDDVDHGFQYNFPGVTSIWSDWIDPNENYFEMSQDQCVSLFMAFHFIHDFVAPDAQVGGEKIQDITNQMAERIIRHISQNNWTIMNPVTGKQVKRGPKPGVFSKGFVKTARNVLGDQIADVKPAWYSAIIWHTVFRAGLVPVFFNRAMVSILGASGQVWNRGSVRVAKRYSRMWDRTVYPFMEVLLNEPQKASKKLKPKDRQKIEELLALMNPGDNPSLKGGPIGWNSTNRHYQAKKHYSSDSDDWTVQMGNPRGSSTDYLILHNIYVLLYRDDLAKKFAPTSIYEGLVDDQLKTP
ncbi:MAG: hypothetical protein JNL01_01255 [Bdellovibrionales bacterium]|nr:hypothetical protein [Bdellovibrionales bacterium]